MWYLKCISRKLGDLSLSELLYYNYSIRGDNIIQSSNMVGEYNWYHVNAYLWIFLQRGILAFLSVNLDHYSSFHCAKNISLGFHWKMGETPLTRPPFELTIIQIFFHKYSYFLKEISKDSFFLIKNSREHFFFFFWKKPCLLRQREALLWSYVLVKKFLVGMINHYILWHKTAQDVNIELCFQISRTVW